MSIILRRAFSHRNLLLLRSSAFHGGDLSHQLINSAHDNDNNSSTHIHALTLPTTLHFLTHSRRGFAKGRKSKEDDAVSTIEVSPDIGPTIKANATSMMEAAIAALSGELNKLRTGRASPGMLDHIIVELDGVKMPLSHLAVVSVMDSKTLSVNPYDPNTIKKLESAIVASPLGLSPKVDGERLIAVSPLLTKEHIQIDKRAYTAVCKVFTNSCEDARQSIRKARQKAMDTAKKLYSHAPKDDVKKLEKEVDELTKKFVKSAEDMFKGKGE